MSFIYFVSVSYEIDSEFFVEIGLKLNVGGHETKKKNQEVYGYECMY